jgi:hypothetical protein
MRNSATYLSDAKERLHGLQGISILSHLKYYKPIANTCIDYMHSVLEGVTKSLFKFWLSPKYLNESFSVRRYMQEIDKRVLSFRPPSFVPTPARSIYEWEHFRAHEYLSFILYFSIPAFYQLMDSNVYANLVKFVIFIETILSPRINRKQLDQAEVVINSFVKDLQDLYHPSIMLSGVHELLHIGECYLHSFCFEHEFVFIYYILFQLMKLKISDH